MRLVSGLYVDMDDTLIKSCLSGEGCPSSSPAFEVEVADRVYGVWLRPDLSLLRGVAFNVFTAADYAYAAPIISQLKQLDFRIGRLYTREDFGQLVTRHRSVLLDDLALSSEATQHKMRALPGGHHIRTQPILFEGGEVTLGPSGAYYGITLSEALTQARRHLL